MSLAYDKSAAGWNFARRKLAKSRLSAALIQLAPLKGAPLLARSRQSIMVRP